VHGIEDSGQLVGFHDVIVEDGQVALGDDGVGMAQVHGDGFQVAGAPPHFVSAAAVVVVQAVMFDVGIVGAAIDEEAQAEAVQGSAGVAEDEGGVGGQSAPGFEVFSQYAQGASFEHDVTGFVAFTAADFGWRDGIGRGYGVGN
jgi:hypothetical protein